MNGKKMVLARRDKALTDSTSGGSAKQQTCPANAPGRGKCTINTQIAGLRTTCAENLTLCLVARFS